LWGWLALAAPVLALAGFVALSVIDEPNTEQPGNAPGFALNSTEGEPVSLDQVLAEGDALLYFSMGVGCDGCFAQIPELESEAAERNLTLVPIMVDPAPTVRAEAARFAIDLPILIDPGAQVATAYGMVGVYGHGDRPSHSFALVRQDRTIAWVRHYAEMFVPSDALFDELDLAVGA
jgi:peroxiredoxin